MQSARAVPLAGPAAAAATALAGASFLLAPSSFAGAAALAALALATLGALAAAVVVPRPRLALVLLVAAVTSRLGGVLAGLGIPNAYLLLLLLAAASAVHGVWRHALSVPTSPVFPAALAVVAVQAVSAVVARDPALTLASVRQTVESLLFLLVLCVLASAPGGVRALVAAAGVTGAVLAGLSVVQEFALGNAWDFGGFSVVGSGPDLGGATARHSGPLDDPNVWGRNLVLLLPLGLLLWRTASTALLRAGAALGVLGLLAGIYLSGSRGALVATAVAVAVWFPFGLARPRRALLMLLVGAAVASMLPGLSSRLATLADAGDAASGGGDPSLAGRVTVLEHAVAMATDHPVLGVGAGNFLLADREYRLRETTWAGPLQAHNLYLEIVAETGALGGVVWLLFLGAAVGVALRALLARRRPADAATAYDRHVALAVVSALAGWLTASVFLHMNEFRLLLVVIAAGVVVDARRHESRVLPPRRTAWPLRERAERLAPAALASAGVLVLAPLVGLHETQWQAGLDARVVAADPARGVPYVHDIATRPFLASTYAQVARDLAEGPAQERVGATTEVEVSPHAAVVSMTATAKAPDDAVAAVTSVLRDARRVLAQPGVRYVLKPSADVQLDRRRVLQPLRALLLVVAAVTAALLLSDTLRARRRTAPRSSSSARDPEPAVPARTQQRDPRAAPRQHPPTPAALLR